MDRKRRATKNKTETKKKRAKNIVWLCRTHNRKSSYKYRRKRKYCYFFQIFGKSMSAKYPNQKVVMVVDNVRYHHAKRLKPILKKYQNKLELVYLPAYSPDLNPIERIWWYMRKKISHNRYLETMDIRIEKFNELMKKFEFENDLGKNLSKLIVNI